MVNSLDTLENVNKKKMKNIPKDLHIIQWYDGYVIKIYAIKW